MSTRSMIGLLREGGVITGIYCHYDGYLSGVGQMLFDYWDTREKVEELMELGDLSVLGKTIGQKTDFENFRGIDQCLAYHRDRGEERRGPTRYLNQIEFVAENDFADYFYVFDGYEWHYTQSTRWWGLLRDLLKKSPELSVG